MEFYPKVQGVFPKVQGVFPISQGGAHQRARSAQDFPVLVEVRKKDTNGFSYDDFYHTGGRDIAFVDDKGHVIPHEIDTWNPSGEP